MSTHNICFQREIRNVFLFYFILFIYFFLWTAALMDEDKFRNVYIWHTRIGITTFIP